MIKIKFTALQLYRFMASKYIWFTKTCTYYVLRKWTLCGRIFVVLSTNCTLMPYCQNYIALKALVKIPSCLAVAIYVSQFI